MASHLGTVGFWRALVLGVWGLALSAQAQAPAGLEIIVNGERLRPETLQMLQQARVPLRSGRYWYDRVSGLWGAEGGPALAQGLPGLALGGALQAQASGGLTAVFVNGRALHPTDIAVLQRCLPVVLPGRYWLTAAGIGGLEGGPPLFNLTALCAPTPSPGGGGGRVLQGDGFTSYTPPAGLPGGIGASCGPDGGCVYTPK